MDVVVATHGHCFDGLASAVLFTHLLKQTDDRPLQFSYRACGYGAGQRTANATLLSGTENAILDYRYHPSPALSWYFDHHRTAFLNAEERADFEARQETGRFFYDPSYSSCTKLIADVAKENFGLDTSALEPLVRWADIVDSAAFDSAEQAIERRDPVLQLVSVVEHYGDDAFITKLVQELLDKNVSDVAQSRAVQQKYKPLKKRHDRFVLRVKERSERRGRVVLVDLTDSVLETIGKFVTYALYPDAIYSVVVALLKNGAKISVGYNPWSGKPLDADISAICARHGGGGHPVVGAIPFRANDLERARTVAREIATELAG